MAIAEAVAAVEKELKEKEPSKPAAANPFVTIIAVVGVAIVAAKVLQWF